MKRIVFTLSIAILALITLTDCQEEDCPLCTSPPIGLQLKLVDEATNANLLGDTIVEARQIEVVNLETNESYTFSTYIEGDESTLNLGFGWDTNDFELLIRVPDREDTTISLQVIRNESRCCKSARMENLEISGNEYEQEGGTETYILKL